MPAHLIAQEGPQKGLLLILEEGKEWVIGRDPDRADLILEDSTVSRKHARLKKTDEGIYLKNLSQINPTLINGETHREPVLLKEGDRIQIGHNLFLFSEEAIPEGEGIHTPEKPKKQGAYDDIFGEAEMPQDPPPVNETVVQYTPPEGREESIPDLPSPAPEEPTAYDTIFEQSEEELPFNLMFETPLILKVIAGPNAGAEIGIEKGKVYTLGKDPNSCEIVFQDMSVSRNHARLTIDPEGVMEIEDLGSKNGTVVNGVALTEKQVITPQDLISLGTTLFMIIDREAPQETIYAPAMPSYEPPKAAPEASPEPLPAEEEAEAKEKNWKLEPIPFKHLVVGGSFLAVFLVIFLSFFSLLRSNTVEVAHKEPVGVIKEALEKFTDVQYSYNVGSGRLFLVGHVSTPVDYQEMKYRLSQIAFITSIEDNVVIDEGVWKSMNDVIGANPNWRGVSIGSTQAGKFTVTGYLQTAPEASSLAEYLTVNFPYLDRLENKVVVAANLDAQLQGILTSQNLGAVTYQLNNGEVILAGRYNQDLQKEYEALLKEINQLPGVMAVKNYAIASNALMASIDLSANYQVTGSSIFDGHGYSVVLNGKIYTLGDRVDGMKITAIETNTILLEKDGLKYRIDYTR